MDALSLRLIFFFGGLFSFLSLGFLFSYRMLPGALTRRNVNNLLMGVLGSVLVWAVIPVSLANLGAKSHWGLFHFLQVPLVFEVILSVVVLDFVVYWQHRLFHRVSLFWRLHRVHHFDEGFDSTTALRFHPLEILISFCFKAPAVVALGLDPLGVLVFEIVLNFSAMFNHSNFSLPLPVEKVLRTFIVTPDFHRIHHSKIETEINSNFGFFLPVWDFLFQTCKAESEVDLQLLENIGLKEFDSERDEKLLRLLNNPFFS